MEKKALITAEFYPAIPRKEIIAKNKYKYSLDELFELGSGFAEIATNFISSLQDVPNSEGLYRCVFPEGVTGHLGEFKDGSGFMGSIYNENGLAAQARWIPVEGQSVTIPVDPITLAIAVAVMSINKKLDQIQETQEEILQFLHQDKESDVEAGVTALEDIMEQYRFNSNNALWKSGKLTAVTAIKKDAEKNIIFYRKQLTNAFEKQKAVHSYMGADKLKNEIEHNLRYYQMSAYMSAYASFLEVILGNNYAREYLEHMARKIRDCSYQYRVDYSKCYEQLEDYMKGTIQSAALSGIGNVSKAAGKALAKVPLLSKGPVDEALISAGSKLKKMGSHHGKEAMRDFTTNSDAGIRLFVENIEKINELSNKPVELLFDRENCYFCA